MSNIAVLGLWHLGEIYSNGLAGLGHKVIGIDQDKATVEKLLKGILPLAEPGLGALLKKNLASGRLTHSHDFAALKKCDVAWFTFDTPVNDRDESDLAPIFSMLRRATPYFKENVLAIVSSQIPVGTSKKIQSLIRTSRPKLKFHYAYAPENLRLGEALDCFLKPDRIVVGANDDEGFRRVENIFRGVKTEFVRMSPASAEMAKHALNAFLATSISFINDIADVCEEAGADVADVIRALRSDPRVGARAALGAGLGFSGGTLGRDLVSLMRIARSHKAALPVIENVFRKNASRPAMLVRRLEMLLGGLKNKHITLLGLTYKPGTTTLRRSRSLEVASLLIKRGAVLTLSDPHVPQGMVPRMKGAAVIPNPYAAAKHSQALVFLTPWPDFKDLRFTDLAKQARAHAIVLDSSNFLRDKEALIKKSGFRYYGVGR